MRLRRQPEVVVITGASAGVGRATWVTLIARREVEALGGRALAVCADVADAEGVEMAAATDSAFGRIDIWSTTP